MFCCILICKNCCIPGYVAAKKKKKVFKDSPNHVHLFATNAIITIYKID